MAKFCFVLALFFVAGFALPAYDDEGPGFDEDMDIFFDHTDTDIEGRIVGGANAPNGAYPWMVAMANGRNLNFVCGGSIVTNRHVLTAAHCIAAVVSGNSLSNTLRVTVGTNRWNSGGQTYSLQRHVNHAQYNANNIKNDIGILVTASNIVMNNAVRQITVNYDHVGGNVPVRVSGWGRIRANGPLSDHLLEIRLSTFDAARCVTEVARVSGSINIRAPHVDPNIEICTFHSLNHGTCNGDSGSPLVRNSNNQQVGIVSWGLPCARGAPDMFVRVSAYRSWIQTNTR